MLPGILEEKSKSYFNKFKFQDISSCVINALRMAFNLPKEEMINLLLKYKSEKKINSELQIEDIWGNFLLDNGYKKIPIQAKIGEKRCTLEEFMENNYINENEKVIIRLGGHIIYADPNGYYDINDTHKNDNVYYYYKLEVRYGY